MKLLLTALATLSLTACVTEGPSPSSNTGRGSVSGSPAGWTAGSGGFDNLNRDSGSSLRGSGFGAGTSGSTGVGWLDPSRPPAR